MKNTVISPDFLVWKFCGKAQFPHSFGKLRYFWQWLFHLNKVRRNYCERTCFSAKNLKCFVTDCKKGDQSKTAVFQLLCQVLIIYFFFIKWSVENQILPPEIQELEFVTPSNRWQLNSRDYLNYDQQVTKVSGANPDTLDFGQIKFWLKYCPNFFRIKTFCEYRKSSK